MEGQKCHERERTLAAREHDTSLPAHIEGYFVLFHSVIYLLLFSFLIFV